MTALEDILIQAGLDSSDSRVYTTLLTHGALTVLDLSTKSGLRRTNLYNILDKLEKQGLVKRISLKKSVKYAPESPREIQKLLNYHEDQLAIAKNTFDILLDNLQSTFNIVSHKPTITYLEGVSGLKKLYQDILDTGKDILLIRSTYDNKRNDVDKLVLKQLTAQVKRGIHASVIGPIEPDSEATYHEFDKLRLVERRFTVKSPLNIPAQILIYGNKTSISTIRDQIIITLIDNSAITETFRALFEFVWDYTTPEHRDLVAKWDKPAKKAGQ